MAENLELLDAFNDCVERMQRGQSMQECLRLYPQYAQLLMPMLRTVQITRQTLTIPTDEVRAAKDRARLKLLDAMDGDPVLLVPLRPPVSRRSRPLLLAAVTVLFVGFVMTLVLSQNTLPGDSLYSLKQFSESVQLIINDSETLRQTFAQRRVDEITALLDQGREEPVTLRGTLESVDGNAWTVDGIAVALQPETIITGPPVIGAVVEISGLTTRENTLAALTVIVDEESLELIPTSTPTTTPSQTPTPSATQTPSRTPSLTASITATSTVTASPTRTPTSSSTPTRTPSRTPSQTLTTTPAVTRTATLITGCIPVQPEEWTTYTVRSGDTLSGIAVATDTDLEDLIEVNCIENPRLVPVGTVLFVEEAAVFSGGDDGGGNGGGDDGGGDDGGDDDDDDDDDDDEPDDDEPDDDEPDDD